jgi:sugar O-acyltransferase (sialic acid O-acetyltransferase NeuD family)
MPKIVVYGAADMARLAHWYISHDSAHEVVAFTVDRAYRTSDSYLDLPVVDFEIVAQKFPPADYQMFVAIGYSQINAGRARAYAAAKAAGYELASYVSSRSTYLSEHAPGENAFILEHCTVQPFVSIGCNVTLWSGSTVAHDSHVGNHCFLASQVAISGFVHVGERCFFGANSTVRDHVRIADRSLIGAGCVIAADTAPDHAYVPARAVTLSKKSDEFDI